MPTEKELDDCVKVIDAGMKYLLGNPLVPNDDGLIIQINNHLEALNGTVEELKKNQIEIQINQNNLLSRWFKSLPAWAQVSIFIVIAGALSQIGVAVKYLS